MGLALAFAHQFINLLHIKALESQAKKEKYIKNKNKKIYYYYFFNLLFIIFIII
jgi:hypothetical protein